jgi:hypothetical protein
MGPLFDALPGISDRERTVAKTRFVKVLDTAERGADRAERLDTSLFLFGFLGSLLVTITTAVNLAGYVTPTGAAAVSTAVLVLSSMGTAAMGLRERLKFRDRAVVLRRTSAMLQRTGFLYLGAADAGGTGAYQAFMGAVEVIKGGADLASLQFRSGEDGSGALGASGGGGGGGPSGPAVMATATATAAHARSAIDAGMGADTP